jgi:hypothetical protein
MDRRLRRVIGRAQRSIRRTSQRQGQRVLWYEFIPSSVEDVDSNDQGTAVDDDLYDEGWSQVRPGSTQGGSAAQWGYPKPVQVFQAMLTEGAQTFDPEGGSYMVDNLTLIVGYQAFLRAGVSNPADRGAHINDRVEYDGRLFAVDAFNPRGRVADTSLTVTVRCLEIKDDELPNSVWHLSR